MKIQSDALVALIFLVAAGMITVLLYNLVYPHFQNINPVGQSIAESLKMNFQMLDYFIQNNTLYVYVKPSEPVNASEVFAIVNNKLVSVYPINSNSTIVNPYNNGLLLIVANLSQIPPDQNGNYEVEVGLENDIIGVFTIHYISNILRQFFQPIIQQNLTIQNTCFTTTNTIFINSTGTFYSYLIVNKTYLQVGWYLYNFNQTQISLTLLGIGIQYSYNPNLGNYTYASLNYNPFQYPTLEIAAGTGGNAFYQYIEWVVVRAYPPNGIMPEIFIQ